MGGGRRTTAPTRAPGKTHSNPRGPDDSRSWELARRQLALDDGNSGRAIEETLRLDPARAYTRCWPSKDSSLPVAQWGSRLQCPDLDVTVAPELSVNAGETDNRFRVLKLGAAGSAMSFAPTRVVNYNQSYA